MRDIAPEVERWLQRGDDRLAIATIVAARGSAPRPLGSKLAISQQGELAGSVSGGCVEGDVAERARELLAGADGGLVTYGISDDQAWSVGLPCGGEIDVYLERIAEPPDRELVERLMRVTRDDERGVLFTVVEGEGHGSQLLALDTGEAVGDGPHELAAEVAQLVREGRNRMLELGDRKVFAEVYGPPFRLLVYGAVDTAEALCALARPLGWRTIVADARARFATRERMPSADVIEVGWPDEVLERVQPDYATAIVVLTHDDKFDLPLLKAAVETEALYIGALGSRRNQARRRERLVEEGVPEEKLERVHGPAGLDLGGGSPAETALSIIGEIVAVRAGRSGGSLRTSSGRIHADPDAVPA